MRIVETWTYRGPNFWSFRPSINMMVDLEELEDFPSDELAGFTDRLLAGVPSLAMHGCSYGEPGGFVRRMRQGTWMGHIMEHLALELQSLTGTPVTQGKTRGTGRAGVYYVVYEYRDERVGLAAGHLALRLIRCLLPPGLPSAAGPEERAAFVLDAELEQLACLTRSVALEPNLAALVRAAEEQRIPWLRASEHDLIQLGYGKHQRRLAASAPGPAVEADAQQEPPTLQLLAEAGLPVLQRRVVATREEALAAASALGYPVVVRPTIAGPDGRRPTIAHSPVELQLAFAAALDYSKVISIEAYVEGDRYRLLVAGGRIVAAVRAAADEPGEPNVVDCSEAARHAQGILGQRIAQSLGFDVADIAVITPDIRQPLAAVGGAISAVRALPDLPVYIAPPRATQDDVARLVMRGLFPPDGSARLPVAAITGTGGDPTVALLVAHILSIAGIRCGCATSAGIAIAGEWSHSGDMAGARGALTVLRDPAVEAAVLETDWLGVMHAGLPFKECDIGAVLSLSADHLGQFNIRTPDDLARVLSLVVEVVRRDGYAVLNADDERIAALAQEARGAVFLFSTRGANERVRRHTADGGMAVVCEQEASCDWLVLYHGDRRSLLLPANEIAWADTRGAPHARAASLAATAIALGLDINLADIRQGLRSYRFR